ncbi:MAG: hypothetical protein C0616_15470 [Desulfuromonas sp.]|nr:MAG: hypothetical protein C0616_15470 [Desulfuromonas sp.]
MVNSKYREGRKIMLSRAGLMRCLVFISCSLLLVCFGAVSQVSGSGNGNSKKMADTQQPEVAEIVVTIREIRAISTNGDQFISLASFSPAKQLNVLDLEFAQELLADVQIPLGDYEQIRLVLGENSDDGEPANYLVFADDPETRVPVDTPSGQKSGLKIEGEFSVGINDSTVVVLEIDSNRVIHQTGAGDWILRPTGIRLVQTEVVLPETEDPLPGYGRLFGYVYQESTTGSSSEPMVGALVEAMDLATYQIVAETTVNPGDGSYQLSLPDGSYALRITADGMVTAYPSPMFFFVLEGVQILVGSEIMTSDSATTF